MDKIEHQILRTVESGPRDASDIMYSFSFHALSWPTDPADPERLKPLTTGQIETVLEHLLSFGLVEYEQGPAARLWSITPAGKDALYDWNPWRFRVNRLIPAARARLEQPRWRWWEGIEPVTIVAVGQFLGKARPDYYQHDALEVENDGRRGWVVDRLFDHPKRLLGAMTVNIDISIGNILIRKSPPAGQPRPEPIRFG